MQISSAERRSKVISVHPFGRSGFQVLRDGIGSARLTSAPNIALRHRGVWSARPSASRTQPGFCKHVKAAAHSLRFRRNPSPEN